MTIPEVYNEAADYVLEEFVDRYYTYAHKDRASDYYWVGKTSPMFVPTVASINDEFRSIADMVLALKLSIPKKVLFDWYYYSLDIAMYNGNKKNKVKKHTVNLYNYFI